MSSWRDTDPIPDVSHEDLVAFARHMGIRVKHYWNKPKLAQAIDAELEVLCAGCEYCYGVIDCDKRNVVSDRELGMLLPKQEREAERENLRRERDIRRESRKQTQAEKQGRRRK